MADLGLQPLVLLRRALRGHGRWIVVALLGLLLARPATGSPVKPGAAIVHFDQGSAAFAEGRFAQALTEFQASMALEPSPNTRIKIARCFKALGKIGSAYVQFHRTSHEAQDRMNATGEARFAPTRDAAEAEALALEKSVPRLALQLPSPAPADLGLELDGTAVPRESFSTAIPIDPGPHHLVATAARFAPFTQDFSVELGAKASVTVQLSRIPTAEVQLAFLAKPAGMTVFFDGKPLPPDDFDKPHIVEPGPHRLEVRVPGYTPFSWQRQLADQDQERVTIALRAEPSSMRWVALSVGGAAVVALAVGAGFGVVAQRTESEQLELDPLFRDRAVQSTVQNQAKLATALLAAGGVLGGAAAVLGVIAVARRNPALPSAKEEPKPVSVKLLPQVLTSGVGLLCVGRY